MGALLQTEELVCYLKHCDTPTILVEGRSDMSVYDSFEDSGRAMIMPCGGRSALLEIFRRRAEFPNAKCAFVADKDTWVFTGVPDAYRDGLILTDGYSIENDILRSPGVSDLYDSADRIVFNKMRDELSIWWAFVYETYKDGGRCKLAYKLQQVLENADTAPRFNPDRLDDGPVGFRDPSIESIGFVRDNFERLIRGHLLCDIHRAVLARGRCPKEKKATAKSLLFVFSRTSKSEYLVRLEDQVGLAIADIEYSSSLVRASEDIPIG